MIVLGLILLVLGLLFGISVLVYLGIIITVLGLVLLAIDRPGPIRGRWY